MNDCKHEKTMRCGVASKEVTAFVDWCIDCGALNNGEWNLPRRDLPPEWCEHCTFARHLHSDTFLPPGCIGFVPKGSARCEKRDNEGRRCSLVADHGGHHEIHAPYDDTAKPMPRHGVSASGS